MRKAATDKTPIAVTSRSFSRHPILRAELLSLYSNVQFNDEGTSLKGQNLIEYCRGRTKLITALETIDESFLAALPELKVIGKYGVGTDMIDKQAMINHKVALGWTGGVNKRSVTELTIAFMISLLRHIPLANRELREGTWKNRKGQYLSERTIGVIGCGHVGKDLIRILKSFGCHVLVHDIEVFQDFYLNNNVEPVSLEALLRRSDVVTLHIPLDDSTRNIISAERLALMKPEAILINTARGGLVDETALKIALQKGKLAAAGFDVFLVEPLENSELIALPNFLCTPHIGGSAEEAILAMGRSAIKGLDEYAIPSEDYPPTG